MGEVVKSYYEVKLDEFYAGWAEKAEKGKVSPISRGEEFILEYFVRFLQEEGLKRTKGEEDGKH